MFTQSNARQLAAVILFSVFFLAISMVSAMNRTCSISTVNANSPEWLAVRQQYETSYLPPGDIHTEDNSTGGCETLS